MSEPLFSDVTKQVERRRLQRQRCDLGITIEWGSSALQGRVSDITTEGMFVALDDPLWIGARFAATLAFGASLPVECVVCRVHPRRGMAVTYSVVAGGDVSALASLIHQLESQ